MYNVRKGLKKIQKCDNLELNILDFNVIFATLAYLVLGQLNSWLI